MTEAEFNRKWRTDKKEKAAEYREAHRDEINARRRENYARKREEKKQAALNPSDPLLAEDDSFRAAKINQQYNLTLVVGATYRGGRVLILEKRASDPNPYRLKRVTYNHFGTKQEALDYCKKHGIDFPLITSETEDTGT